MMDRKEILSVFSEVSHDNGLYIIILYLFKLKHIYIYI